MSVLMDKATEPQGHKAHLLSPPGVTYLLVLKSGSWTEKKREENCK